MDIAEFAIIRPARGVDPALVARPPTRLVLPPKPGGRLMAYVPAPITLTAESLPDTLSDRHTDPLAVPESTDGLSVLERIFAALRHCEQALTAASDRLDEKALRELLKTASTRQALDSEDWTTLLGGKANSDVILPIAQLMVHAALADEMTKDPPDHDRAVRLTRLALVADVLAVPRPGLTATQTYDLLHRRPLVLPKLSKAKLAPKARVNLIREATVRDLQVVRREWTGYLPGEIASVRNMMAGESFNQYELSSTETETTTTTTTERTEQSESSSESKLASELSASLSTELGVTVNGHADASAEYSYPTVTARISGGVDGGLSLQRSETQASKIVREAVSRATSRVDTMTRETRARRELTHNEQRYEYSLKNSSRKNAHGIYRWVDRVDTYQLFRYTDRLQLEFQIPEPAEFFRWRHRNAEIAASAVDTPPEWSLKAEDITEDKLIELAAKYRATSLPPPPDPSITVVRTLIVDSPTPAAGRTWNPPVGAKELDIQIPTDYITDTVTYTGEGFPLAGEWKNDHGDDEDGLRSGFATVAIGGDSTLYFNGGVDAGPVFHATHGDNTDVGTVQTVQFGEPPYGRGLLPIGSDGSLDPAPVTVDLKGAANLVKVAVGTLALLSCTVTFAVKCTLSPAAEHRWKLAVYDALFSAWLQWKRDHEAEGMRKTLLGQTGAIDAGGTQRNDQVVREELKRLLVAWLLDDAAFGGKPALLPRARDLAGKEIDFANMDVARAIADAPTIQFLEQAFEWTNLSYAFYPYFWAHRTKWEELSQITSNDAEFERFLRAGSARVIVPARPNFEDAVRNWLVHTVPFLNGQLPTPDDDLFISLDTEIREMTSPQIGGVAGDHWQTKISTTMLYLDTAVDLPFTNDKHQLPAPAGVPYTPGPIFKLGHA
ncbi:hypothetical protein [Micromonospora sp. NPDC005173]|uniref:hypothetical protein n=1 Tax=Micromonospora sp. NPDC005173 TaxID=3157165 RepID=UPI0033A495CE